MASILLKSAGAAVGNMLLPGFGGVLGGALGSVAGGMVDQSLGLNGRVTGPRLDSLAVQDSRYGAGIPVIYGTARVAGNVIWATDLIQTTHRNSVGGKGGMGGGASAETYSYSVHCAVGIAEGPIGAVATIWADSKIIYQNGAWVAGVVDAATIYTGAVGQAPDPFMQSLLGADAVPAWRGLAYVVFENLQLANFGNRLPNLTFEIAPPLVTQTPTWLGSVDVGVSQRDATVQNGGMLPLVLGSGAVLVGGYVESGASSVFEVVRYDVTGDAPVELNRTQSASFATSTVSDCSWALAPDGRFVVMVLQSGAAINHWFVIYDTETRQFGTPLGAAMAG